MNKAFASSDFDVLVVGGGPGGYVAAIRSAQLGLKTALIEKAELGGVCLNWGCIPTKALLRSADVLRLVKASAEFGVKVGAEPVADVGAMVKRSRAIAGQLSNGVTHLLKKNGVALHVGRARLLGGGSLEVTDGSGGTLKLAAQHIVLATGASPVSIPKLPVDRETVWSYREAVRPSRIPKKMVIVGGGAIGIEFASFYNAVGVEVTVIEKAPSILPNEDEEVSAEVGAQLRREGIALHVGTTVHSASRSTNAWELVLRGESSGPEASSISLRTDVVLVAAGIVGNVEDLGLENTAVRVDRTHIVTDEECRTGEAGVYAIGDVAGPPWLAHKASHEGVACVERIAGIHSLPLNRLRIPSCTYSHPQVASIGLTERQARDLGKEINVGRFPFSANGKAIALGSSMGFAKVVFDKASGELIGAHMVGDEVTELIQGFLVAQSLETTEAELMSTVFPHPTQSEALHEAVLSSLNRALHI